MDFEIPRLPSNESRKFLNPPADVFRFRVMLNHVEPTIWRVFDVPANLRLPVLSDTILAAMGWKNKHLHLFRTGNITISPRYEDDDPFRTVDEYEVFIAAMFHVRGESCEYVYDLGDHWEHTVQMLDFFPREKGAKYPALVDGARACPPEDAGGPHMYSAFLKSGDSLPRFDPAEFNFVTARNRVRKVPLRPQYGRYRYLSS